MDGFLTYLQICVENTNKMALVWFSLYWLEHITGWSIFSSVTEGTHILNDHFMSGWTTMLYISWPDKNAVYVERPHVSPAPDEDQKHPGL